MALTGDRAIAAYRDGDNRNVTMIDSSGKATGKPYMCWRTSEITGLIYYQPWVYIIQWNGTITKLREDLHPDHASVVKVKSYGHIHPGDVLQEDLILLTNQFEGTVFTYNMKTETEETKITDMDEPAHVFQCEMDGQPVYVVTEFSGCHIKIYNSDWNLMREIGSRGSQDGELVGPQCTVILPNGDLLVADCWNNRISQFKQDGVFVKHLIIWIDRPRWMSFRDSMLWVISGPVNGRRVACFQISEKVTIFKSIIITTTHT